MKRTYEIDGMDVAATLAKAQKIAARAQSKGLTGGFTVTVEKSVSKTRVGSETKTYLVIEGEPAQYGGWTFVAKVEFVGGEPVVTGSPWYEGEQVDRSALKPDWCDECGKKIARSKTIVVEKDGQRLQVGTACVKDFLGQDVSPTWFSAKDPFDEFDGYAGGGEFAFDTVEVLATAALVIRKAGFVPKKAASEDFTVVPTAEWVQAALGVGTPQQVGEALKRFGQAEAADYETATAALEFGRGFTGFSDYEANVRAVLAGEEVSRKFIGLVVSVVGVFVRKQAEAKATEAVSPAPEGRVTVTGVVTARKVTENFGYGTQVKLTVKSDTGFKVWVTAGKGLERAEPGDTVEFTATLTRSDRDETFAFGKFPKGGKVLQAA